MYRVKSGQSNERVGSIQFSHRGAYLSTLYPAICHSQHKENDRYSEAIYDMSLIMDYRAFHVAQIIQLDLSRIFCFLAISTIFDF